MYNLMPIKLFDEMVVETATGLVRLPELSSRLTIGDKGNVSAPPYVYYPLLIVHLEIY